MDHLCPQMQMCKARLSPLTRDLPLTPSAHVSGSRPGSHAALLSPLPSQLTAALFSGVELSHVAGSQLRALLEAGLPHLGNLLLQTLRLVSLSSVSSLLIPPSSCHQVYFSNTQLCSCFTPISQCQQNKFENSVAWA